MAKSKAPAQRPDHGSKVRRLFSLPDGRERALLRPGADPRPVGRARWPCSLDNHPRRERPRQDYAPDLSRLHRRERGLRRHAYRGSRFEQWKKLIRVQGTKPRLVLSLLGANGQAKLTDNVESSVQARQARTVDATVNVWRVKLPLWRQLVGCPNAQGLAGDDERTSVFLDDDICAARSRRLAPDRRLQRAPSWPASKSASTLSPSVCGMH